MSLSRYFFASAVIVMGTVTARADNYSFAGSVGATAPFSVSSGSNKATFTSTPGNAFQVQNTSGLFTFSSPSLVDNNFFGTDPLTITFQNPVVGLLVIPFGIEDAGGLFGPDSLTVSASDGQTATFAATPDSLALAEPEGVVNLALTSPVTSVTLNGTNAFAIGSVSTVTPEPASLVLAGTGLVGFLLRRRRKTEQ